MEEDAVSRSVRLSLLERNDTEKDRLVGEVHSILSFISDVKEITVSEDAAVGAVNVFRDDRVTVSAGKYQESLLSQAPARFKSWLVAKNIL